MVSSTRPSNTPRTRTGCQSCRTRHLKCDEGRPSCTRCTKSDVECIRGFNIRFRHGANPSVSIKEGNKCEYDFSEDQKWLQTSNTALIFVDETEELVEGYEGPRSTSPQSAPEVEDLQPLATHLNDINPLPVIRSDSFGSVSQGNPSSPEKRRRLICSPTSHPNVFQTSPSAFPESPLNAPFYSPITISQDIPTDYHHRTSSSSTNIFTEHVAHLPSLSQALGDIDDFAESPSNSNQQDYALLPETPSQIYLDVPAWPLPSHEAFLMRHFVEELARSFDLCDAARHFATVIPHRAAICPTLLNAIFAASARHLSRLGNYDVTISDRYHQKCLSHLIPMLNDETAIMDENLLAATVILRYLEEIEVPLTGCTDGQSHLLGTHVFISAQGAQTVPGGLRQAAFWVALRQECYVAFVNQRTIAPALEHPNINRSFDPADDHTWANRIIVHTADVIRFCYGNGKSSSYDALTQYCEQWMALKPASFSSIYYAEPKEGQVFPDIWLLGDHVVCALQHYHLALILLAAHDPNIPKLGPASKAAFKIIDTNIKHSVLALCGMALSNLKAPPNFVTACLGVAMCGERFTERAEQDALMNILRATEREHAWPTGTAVQTLTDAWDWD